MGEVEDRFIIFGDPSSEGRAVAATDAGYWIANYSDYDIRHISYGGDTIARFTEAPAWWGPGDFAPAMSNHMETSPFLLDVGVDTMDRVWVVYGLPVPDVAGVDALLKGQLDITVATALQDHVLRIYDSAGGGLVLEERFDYMPLRFLSRTLGAVALPSGDSIVISIRRLGLAGDLR